MFGVQSGDKWKCWWYVTLLSKEGIERNIGGSWWFRRFGLVGLGVPGGGGGRMMDSEFCCFCPHTCISICL